MSTSDAPVDTPATPRRDERFWKALALLLGAVVILETLLLAWSIVQKPPAPPAAVVVPTLIGRPIAEARAIIEAIGLEIEPTGRVSDQPESTVLDQDPAPGTMAGPGSVVRIVIATAVAEVVVPDLLGLPEGQALRALTDAGLVAGRRSATAAPLIDDGAVASQEPAAGRRVPRGTPVDFTISVGAVASSASSAESPTSNPTTRPTTQGGSARPPIGQLPVADYRCMVLQAASERIRDDGFKVGRITYSIEGGPVDDTWVVMRQDPSPGATLGRGGPIDIMMASPFGTCQR